jgi:hypothetical protein
MLTRIKGRSHHGSIWSEIDYSDRSMHMFSGRHLTDSGAEPRNDFGGTHLDR